MTVTAVVVVTIALATIALVIGLLLRWLCEPWRAPDVPVDEEPSHFTPQIAGRCARCHAPRYRQDLTYARGVGLVCADDCLPPFVRPVLTAPCDRCGEWRLRTDLAYTRGIGMTCADGCQGAA